MISSSYRCGSMTTMISATVIILFTIIAICTFQGNLDKTTTINVVNNNDNKKPSGLLRMKGHIENNTSSLSNNNNNNKNNNNNNNATTVSYHRRNLTLRKRCLNSELRPKYRLHKYDSLCSPHKTYKFGIYRNYENVYALYIKNRHSRSLLWEVPLMSSSSSAMESLDDIYAIVKTNGNLVVNDADGRTLWKSNSRDGPGADLSSLVLGDDGILRIVTPLGRTIWSSDDNNDDDDDDDDDDDNDNSSIVSSNTLHNKIMSGYQGWFYTPNDGGYNDWKHWSSSRQPPSASTITIDLWPDLREYTNPSELEPTPAFHYKIDGSNSTSVGLYSAYNPITVHRHVKWMSDYGLDGVFVQRFIGEVMGGKRHLRDKVLDNVRRGCERYGRVFANMYDISSTPTDDDDVATTYEALKTDWIHLVDDDEMGVLRSDRYLHHDGRPVLAIWGFGFDDRVGDPEGVLGLIKWFREEAPPKYRVTLMGGVPTKWRSLEGDSKSDPRWMEVYRAFDVVSPWAVGRYKDEDGADRFLRDYVAPEVRECQTRGVDYLPVVFPGFSVNNLNPSKPFNEIPRRGGTFLWRQLYNAIALANANMVYVAMFDEVDEGTAIYKVAETQEDVPKEGKFLTLDEDEGYDNVPSDWYLRLVGEATGFLKKGGQGMTPVMPTEMKGMS